MCGIFGLIRSQGQQSNEGLGDRLHFLMQHRGPDDFGALSWSQDGCFSLSKDPAQLDSGRYVMAHWRLSILDLSATGWQPMVTPDKRYFIVYNGEIYNFVELRNELESLGWRFKSQSDTEVLLYSYVQWGASMLKRLIGMFAFAILDTVERRLFIARDFFGIKPLFYSSANGAFAFASEIKVLLQIPGISRRINPRSLHDYLLFGATDRGEATLFADIRHLPPAHYMEISCDNPKDADPVCYWEIDLRNRLSLSYNEAAARLRDMFVDSVRLHLRSDVPVGAALSGGIDSSSIVMAMRYLEPSLELHTFSFIADDPAISEEHWADKIGAASGAIMHKVRPTPEEMVADLDFLINVQDEPFGSTSIYAQQRVFKLAKENGIKVMLDGQGADELLAGYSGYLSARLASLIRQGKWFQALDFASHAGRHPQVGIKSLIVTAGGMLTPKSLRPLARKMVNKDLMPEWLREEWFASHGVVALDPDLTSGSDILRQQLCQSMQTSLRHLLRYEDRNSMSHSVESRVPFLTPQLAEFIYALPEEYLVDGKGERKAVFRQAMRGLVPDSILDRKDKIGFGTPEQRWLNSLKPWVDGILQGECANSIPAINIDVMKREWMNVSNGRAPFDWRIWRWINLIRWVEIHAVIIE